MTLIQLTDAINKNVTHTICLYFLYQTINLNLPSLNDLGSNPGEGEIFYTYPWSPSSLLYDGYWVSFPGVKQPGCGNDHPPPSSAKVREKVKLYLDYLGLHGLLQGELYFFFFFLPLP